MSQIKIDDIKSKTVEQLVDLYRNGHTIEKSGVTGGCNTCESSKNLSLPQILSLAKVGDVITLKSSGSGGTPNYTAFFSQSGGAGSLSVSSVPNLAENVIGASTYTVVPLDARKTITFTSYVTDNCATSSKQSPNQTRTVTIDVPCVVPVCNFTVT